MSSWVLQLFFLYMNVCKYVLTQELITKFKKVLNKILQHTNCKTTLIPSLTQNRYLLVHALRNCMMFWLDTKNVLKNSHLELINSLLITLGQSIRGRILEHNHKHCNDFSWTTRNLWRAQSRLWKKVLAPKYNI